MHTPSNRCARRRRSGAATCLGGLLRAPPREAVVDHLGELEFVGDMLRGADLVVDWQQGPGEVVEVPALASRFWIRERATLSP